MVRLARILTCSLGLAVLAHAGPASAREAFVTEFQQKQVVVFDTQTDQLVGSPIPLGEGTHQIAITPDGHRAYTADLNGDKVFAIDTEAKASLGSITVGSRPSAVAITPDGRRVYVANSGTGTGANTVSVIDTQTNQTVGAPIPVGTRPNGIAITPDGTRAYVTNSGDNTVAVIDLQTNQVVGPPIPVGMEPFRIAITPNGARLYVTNVGSDNVSVIDTATNQMIGSPIPTADDPEPLAITPDGTRVIVGHYNADAVSIIDTATNQVVGSPIPVGISPAAIAISPDGTRAYASNDDDSTIGPVVIDTRTGQATSGAIVLNNFSTGIAIVPDQPPQAAFTHLGTFSGQPLSFNAAASNDPDGTIARYDWSFGDGSAAPNAGPVPSHVYGLGTFQPSLTLTDNEGCSTAFVFTGQTASCNGGPGATASGSLAVREPKPTLTHVSQTARRWIEGAGLPRISRRRRLPVGTSFRFTLNEPAGVRFAFTQRRPGRRVGHRCVPATRRNKGKLACKRTVTVAALPINGHAGANRVRFKGQISRRKKLKQGKYTLVITARDSAGARSAARRLSFTIVKR
jgi:YVTN family beta-propeller protein